MFVRVAKFEGGDMERLKEERPRMTESEKPAGMLGHLVIADEAASRRMFITFFDTRESAEEAERFFDSMGDTIPEEIRGKRVSHGIYEAVDANLPALVQS
jgi:hypothetical protein